MPTVRIQHPIADYDSWKQAFDSDPVGRERSGVRRYQILRPVDDPNFVMIDLDFDNTSAAESFLVAMRGIWSRVQGTIMENPRAWIVEVAESKQY